MKKISKRHAVEICFKDIVGSYNSIDDYLNSKASTSTLDNPRVKNIVDSFIDHSGGTKSTHSIINYLRERLGNDIISFSDQDLLDYIENRKKEFSQYTNHADDFSVGRVGLDTKEQYEDNVADYYSKAK